MISAFLILMGYLILDLAADQLSFIDPTSLGLVAIGGLCFWLSQHRGHVLQALRVSWSGEGKSAQDKWQAYETLRNGRNLFMAMAALGFFIGAVGMLRNLEDPTRIGPAMAVSILSLFYGVLLGLLICGPLMHRVGVMLGADAATPPHMIDHLLQPPSASAPLSMGGVIIGPLALFFLILSVLD